MLATLKRHHKTFKKIYISSNISSFNSYLLLVIILYKNQPNPDSHLSGVTHLGVCVFLHDLV